MPFGLREEMGIRKRDFVIEADNVVKSYRRRKSTRHTFQDFIFPQYEEFHAVDDLSIKVKEGEIYGLLGPNGAGKTTLIRILTGLLLPERGRVLVDGRAPEKTTGSFGVVFGSSMIYHRITGYDNLKFFAKLYKVKNYRKRIDELANFFELEDWINSYVEQYSNGMKSKLALARALIHDPSIVFLDEPTLGLDPKISMKIREQIKDMEKTILVTTHYMDEANELCDRIGIINHGRMVMEDTPANLKKLVAKNVVVEIGLSYFGEVLLERLRTEGYIHNVELSENGIRVLLDHRRHLPELLSFLADYKITTINEDQPSLVDVFVRLTGSGEETGEITA